MVIRTEKVKLYPNRMMKKALDDLCNYRRYCWNQGLALWNDMYDESLIMDDQKCRPNERKVRNELVHNKQDWQFTLSARCYNWLSLILEKRGRISSTKLNLTGVNRDLSPRKRHVKGSRPIVPKSLMANCA